MLEDALPREVGSVVGLSANRTALELRGPHARDVLAAGCSLDLHPRAFGPGDCAQTLLARAAVILHQTEAEPVYRILVRGSFAGYLADWLIDAAAGRHRGASFSSIRRRQRSVFATSLNV